MDFLRNSISGIDFLFLIPVLVCIAASALVGLLPTLRSRYGLLTISLLATAGVYRRAILGYVLINLVTYLVVSGLARIPASPQLQRQHRWRWSIAAMLVLVIVFLAGRYYQLET